MPLDVRVVARFQDILNHARDALRYVANTDQALFQQDDMRHRAVERCLEVIGEAARALPEPIKTQFNTIPWPMMVGMRNILTHEYGRVNLVLVYRTVVDDLPVLIQQVEAILAAHAPPSA